MPGMMSEMPVSPPNAPTQGGLLSGGAKQGKFNGDITVGDKVVHVTDGLVDGSDDQHKVFVAADGSVVFNEKNQILGSLDAHNVLQKPTPELIAHLQSLGVIQPPQTAPTGG